MHEAAAWQGHPHYWMSDDITLARHEANGAVAPDGTGATLRWHNRSRLSAAERRRFQAALAHARRMLEGKTATAYSERVRERSEFLPAS